MTPNNVEFAQYGKIYSMKKIMFVTQSSWKSISDLLYYIQEFTINNGGYPDIIDMTPSGENELRRLLKPEDAKKKTLKFLGIKVRVI